VKYSIKTWKTKQDGWYLPDVIDVRPVCIPAAAMLASIHCRIYITMITASPQQRLEVREFTYSSSDITIVPSTIKSLLLHSSRSAGGWAATTCSSDMGIGIAIAMSSFIVYYGRSQQAESLNYCISGSINISYPINDAQFSSNIWSKHACISPFSAQAPAKSGKRKQKQC